MQKYNVTSCAHTDNIIHPMEEVKYSFGTGSEKNRPQGGEAGKQETTTKQE
jgi:hypothetical protein